MPTILDLHSDPQIAAVDRRRGHRFQPPKADLAKIPPLYGTDEIPVGDKIVHLHFFVGACDWYVVEIDPETMVAYGHADLGMGYPEWGYISLAELAAAAGARVEIVGHAGIAGHTFRAPVERDLYFTPVRFAEIAEQNGYRL